MLHYNPQYVSSSNLLIFRRTNCIISIDPYRITHPLDMGSGYNNTECVNNYNIWDFSAI